MTAGEYFGEIAKTPILAISIFVISVIAIFLDAPLIIPTFAASLFTLLVIQQGTVKDVIGSHSVAFIIAMTAPFFIEYINFLPDSILQAAVFGVIVLATGLVLTITKLEHPPAIASTIVFFEAEKGGRMLFELIPINVLIAFGAGLLIVALVAHFMRRY